MKWFSGDRLRWWLLAAAFVLATWVIYGRPARADLWGPNKWDSSGVYIWCDKLTGDEYVILSVHERGVAITHRDDAPSCKED